ncbi:MarR family winged helix-turn-helix transcriptional regulator [Allofustis seminis]|uniref:MarR family winged helix-turn-helix transcriptional regulator n=1 Tax=Allofustis seminis TaxID=166939 RepID=UPI0003729176|nr:MarR family transcriptional regulator [Allofustis seminis]
MSKTVDIKALLKQMEEVAISFDAAKKRMLAKEKLNASTIYLISIIGEDTLTLKQITERAQLDKSTVSRQMNTLEKLQLVERKAGEDKRFAFFNLTSDAKMHYNNYIRSFTAYLNQTLIAWSEEEKQMLLVLLGRLDYSLHQSMKDN